MPALDILDNAAGSAKVRPNLPPEDLNSVPSMGKVFLGSGENGNSP